MYDDSILNLEYFKSISPEFQELKVETVLDSLTKVVLRKYILDYAQYLINNNIPFSFQIIDIDNFKRINDNYGHQMGDEVLLSFATKLSAVIGNNGLVGRYGGDEFIVIVPKIHGYDEVKEFISSNFFGPGAPMRIRYRIGGLQTFITGTIGSASFPEDARSFDELFLKADKALYRGKTKGRNCYIIYVDSKHRDIDVNKGNKKLLQEIFYDCEAIMEKSADKDAMIKNLNDFLIDTLKLSTFDYFPDNSKLGDIDSFLNQKGIGICTSSKELKKYPELKQYYLDNNVLALLICKGKIKDNEFGYFIFTESKINRIWQDEDITLIMYISKLFGLLNR